MGMFDDIKDNPDEKPAEAPKSLFAGIDDSPKNLFDDIKDEHKPLEEHELYGAGTPFYEIAKTIGSSVLESPIGPAIKTVLGFTKQNYDKIIQQQQIGEAQFQAQTWHPNFEYYANVAIRATTGALINPKIQALEVAQGPASYLLNKAKEIPEHFNMLGSQLPSIGKLDLGKTIPNIEKYSPAFIALAKLSGGDLNKVNEKMWLGVGLDTLSFAGLDHVAEMVAKGGSEALKTVQAMDAPSQFAMNKNLAEVKNAGLADDKILEESLGGATKGTLEDAEIEALQAKDNSLISNQSPQPPLTPAELLDRTDMSQFVFNDVVYKMQLSQDGKSLALNPLRAANATDKYNHIFKEGQLIAMDRMGRDINSIYDFFPKEGQVDISPERFTKYGPAAIVMSPQTYAPVLFEQIGQLERARAGLSDKVFGEVAKFWKQATAEQSDRVGRYMDYPWQIKQAIEKGNKEAEIALKKGYEELSKTMTPFEMSWANSQKNAYESAADMLGIPRNEDYLSHVFKDMQNKTFEPNAEINLDSRTGEWFLNKRLGLPGYITDAKKIGATYVDWFAKKMLDEPHKMEMLKTIKTMIDHDDFSGQLAKMYFHNYFGDLKREMGAFRNIDELTNKIISYPTAAWLTLNPNPSLLNITQAVLGGSAKIGYGPMVRGISHVFSAMYDGSEEAMAWKKILNDSAVLMNKSMTELTPIKTFWEKIPGVGKLFTAGKYPLQWSENMGKASIYLGAYEDTFQKITSTKLGVKDWSQWLGQHGIDVTKDAGNEAFKYARKAAYDVHMDWTKAGQTTIQQIPIARVFTRFAQAPYKITEFATKTALGAANNVMLKAFPALVKGDFQAAKIAITNPSVKTAIRLAANYTLFSATLLHYGVNPARFAWDVLKLNQHTGRLVSFFIDGMKKVVDEWERQDPRSFTDTAKYVGTVLGFPLMNAGGKILHLMDIANDPDNRNRTDGKVFVRDPRNPRSGFTTDWTHLMIDTLTPAADMKKVEHYDQLKAASTIAKKIMSNRQAERIATFNGDQDRRRQLRQQQIQNNIQQRNIRRQIQNTSRGR